MRRTDRFAAVAMLSTILFAFATRQATAQDAKHAPAEAREPVKVVIIVGGHGYDKKNFDKAWGGHDDIQCEVWDGQPYTVFDLTVAEPKSIGFRNLGFQGCKPYCSQGGEGPRTGQVFLGSKGQDCCVVDCCSTGDQSCGTGYWVMQDFMEGQLHPTSGYDHFSLRFIVWTDIDALPDGPTTFAVADLWRLNLWNTDEVMEAGNESDHNVVGAYWIPLEDVVVERSGDEWTVTVNQCGFEGVDGCPLSNIEGQITRPIVFWETYYQGILKPIGKSGKFNLDSEYRRAVGSGTHFKFVTKWKRISN